MQKRPVRLALISAESTATCAEWYQPFNYSIRKIEAAVRADPSLQHVETTVIDCTYDGPEDCAQRIANSAPDIVGASTYYWSFPHLVRVARELKRRRPNCLIIFGGPSAAAEMFSVPGYTDGRDFVDALVPGEGELVIRDLLSLAQPTRADLLQVPGLEVAGPDDWIRTSPAPLPVLDDLPSPLQMGLLPAGTSGHVETFRGCPMSCTFCEWGDTSASQRAFSEEYLLRELRALKAFNPKGIFLIDAGLNLNAKAFRNLAAAEKEVGLLREQPVHMEVYPSHLNEAQLQFLKDIKAESVGIGLQSYDMEVNRRLGRPSDAERFERVVREVIPIASSTWIEIILGLPGDNPDSFVETLDRARKLGAGVRVARCLVLPKALLSRAPAHFELDFDPDSLAMRSCWGWPGDSIDKMARYVGEELAAAGGDGIADSDYWAFPQTTAGAPKYSWTELKPDHRRPAKEASARPTEIKPIEIRSTDAKPAEIRQSEDSRPAEQATEDKRQESQSLDPALSQACQSAVHKGSDGAWDLVGSSLVGELTELTLSIAATESVVLRIEPAHGIERSYKKLGDLAYSYSSEPGQKMPRMFFARLGKVIEELHRVLRPVGISIAKTRDSAAAVAG